jgi:hypothetical protein
MMTFLKAQGIRGLVGKNDWPRYTEEEPEIYEQEELHKLFAACDADERLWFEFFLMTGNERAGSNIHVLVGCQLCPCGRSSKPQARSRMDTEGVQGAGASDPCEACGEAQGEKSESRQEVWSGVSNCRMQS